VVLIEHHTELLGICDRLVELGPGGGEAGGRVIASGTPDELASNPDSVTGPWLGRGPTRSRQGKTPRRKRARRTPVRQENR
jgi:excinuclease ABC subunit A